MAGEIGKPPSQVALNWLRQRDGVLPIVGARTLDQFRENCGCLEFSLEADQIERLNKVSQIELGFPHDFLTSEIPRNFLYGGFYDQIDPR